eukprot:g334.t1
MTDVAHRRMKRRRTRRGKLPPLHAAAAEGDLVGVQVLMQSGAVVNSVKGHWNKEPALISACRGGHYAVVDYLLHCGADVTLKGRNLSSPFHAAAASGDLSVGKLIVGAMKDAEAKRKKAEEAQRLGALKEALARGEHPESVEIIEQEPIRLWSKDSNGWTALHSAAQKGKLNMCKWLLRAELRSEDDDLTFSSLMNMKASDGKVAAHLAAECGDAECMTWFLNNGTSIEAATLRGMTLLHLSCRAGKVKSARQLCKLGANILSKDAKGFTALMHAAARSHNHVLHMLLRHAAQNWDSEENHPSRVVNMNTNLCWTPLTLCTREGNAEGLQLLLEYEPDPDAFTKTGFSALGIAARDGNARIANLLVQRFGADVNAQNAAGRSPLHFACQYGATDVAKLLLSNGAAVDIEDLDGNTPLILACGSNNHGQISTIKLLLQRGASTSVRNIFGENCARVAFRAGCVQALGLLMDLTE